MKVYQAIGAVSAAISNQGISKARKNTQQGYNFRGIDDVLNALSSALVQAGLVILPRCVERECVERTTAKGNALFYVTCKVEFDLVSTEDGSKHTVCTYGEAMDSADKATNKAMSAAYKYLALLVFCIPTESTPDADQDSHDVKPKEDVAHSGPAIAFSELQPEVQTFLRKATLDIIAAMPDAGKAVQLIEMVVDNYPDEKQEVKAGLWSLLDSKTRSAIKAHQKAL